MSFVEQETLVGITDIAEMARAKRAAVSNWPKRYADFPKPRKVSPSGALYDANEVERWLMVKGKIDGPIPPELRLWKQVDRLRDRWSPGDTTDFLAACIVFLGAAPGGSHLVSAGEEAGEDWEAIRASQPSNLLRAVLAAGRIIEARIPILDGVITRGLDRSPRPDDLLLEQTLDFLSAASNETPLEDLFLEVLQRLTASDRSFGAHETRSDLAELMIRLVRHNSGTIFDPAAGMGGLLQMAALHPDFPSLPDQLIGYEVNERVARLARAQCFLYGMVPQGIGDTRIECRDSLRESATLDVEADLVLLDPPLNLREWGDTDLYLDHETWRFGLPSPRSAEFAWVQLAINALKPDGRAIVVLPALAASTGGRDERIRRHLVRAGCVETVIFLPARFGGDSSVPLSVWILRRPSSERDDDTEPSRAVLLIDATPLGARSPLDQWADELDIDDIVAAAHSASSSHMDPSLVIAVSTELIAEDGNLSFRHYQPLPAPPDLNDLEREVDELARSVGDSTKQLSERVLELSRLLKESS